MSKLSELLQASAMKAVNYFTSNITEEGSLVGATNDLSCYFKLPMLLIKSGKKELAEKILVHLYANFMTKGGDFGSDSKKKSDKSEYTEYWSYMNGWIIRAAKNLDLHHEGTDVGYSYLSKFHKGDGQGFLTHHLEKADGVTDVLTAAHHGLIHLENNNMELAISAANYLLVALIKQPDITNYFHLRIDNDNKPITKFDDKDAMFFCINKKKEQLYFMIAYPCAFLASLYQKTKDEKFLEASIKYMDFALSCHESVYASNFSHKLAWAASVLYEITKQKKYLEAVTRISEYFLKTQDENGMWLSGDGVNTSYDQSAEIGLWFLEIAANLDRVEKKLGIETTGESNQGTQSLNIIKHGILTILTRVGLFSVYKKIAQGCGQNDANLPKP